MVRADTLLGNELYVVTNIVNSPRLLVDSNPFTADLHQSGKTSEDSGFYSGGTLLLTTCEEESASDDDAESFRPRSNAMSLNLKSPDSEDGGPANHPNRDYRTSLQLCVQEAVISPAPTSFSELQSGKPSAGDTEQEQNFYLQLPFAEGKLFLT